MPKWLHIAWKDTRVTARNRSAVIILLVFPSVLILILGLAFGGLGGGPQFGGIPVAIVNLDRGSATEDKTATVSIGAEITDALVDDRELGEIVDITTSGDTDATREAVASGELAAAVIIPADFTESIEEGDPTTLEVLQDPGSTVAAGVWTGIVRSIASRVSGEVIAVRTAVEAVAKTGVIAGAGMSAVTSSAVAAASKADALGAVTVADARAAEKRQTTPLDYYAASMTAMFLLFGCMFGAFSFVEERSTQTMQRMLSSPTPSTSIVGGKLLAVVLLGIGQFGVLYLFTRLVLDTYWGDPVGVWLIVIGELIATAGLASVVSGLARTRRGVGGIAPITVQVMALLGGAFFPIAIFPAWLQPVQYVSIVGWAMDGFLALQNGAAASAVYGNAAALVAIGLVLFVVGVTLLRGRR